jgi:hypothetical protein
MGNTTSIPTHSRVETCIICWENIESTNKVDCFRCNISLHTYCEETDRSIRRRHYCKCPHCQGIGTLSTT